MPSFFPIKQQRFISLFMVLWLCSIWFLPAGAQDKNPEFSKGFTGYLFVQQGVVTDFGKYTPRHYQVGLGIRPEWTLVPGLIRVGLQTQLVNAVHAWQLQAGPTVSLCLIKLKAGSYGTFANVQLTAGYLWGPHRQRLAGGGCQMEIFQLATLGLSAYRDYGNRQWWIQTAIGFNLLMKRQRPAPDPFSQP